MAKVAVTLSTKSGAHVVADAERYGEFAIHPSLDLDNGFDAKSYTVTHIRTGRAACWGLPSRSAAIHAARRLTAARLNWKFSDEKQMPKRTRERGRMIARECQGWPDA